MEQNRNDLLAYQKFMSLLDEKYVWPSDYIFKFIIKSEQLDEFKCLLGNIHFEYNSSKNGKYLSVTFTSKMDSAISVVNIYQKVSSIPGIVSL